MTPRLGFVTFPRELPETWNSEDLLAGLMDWLGQEPDPAEHGDALRELTTRMIAETPLTTGPAGVLIGNGLVLDMDPKLAAGIALRYAGDASAAIQAGDLGKAADHLANAYLAAFKIGPLGSPEVRSVTAILDRVAVAWARGGDAA